MTTKYPGSILTDGAATSYSVAFDGTGDSLSVADNSALELGSNNFTIEAWIYTTSATTRQTITAKTNSGGNDASSAFIWQIGTSASPSNATLNFYHCAATTYVTASSTLASNTWYHIAIVRSGNTFTQYINGTANGTASISTAIRDIAEGVYIGNALYSVGFAGNISNFRIVNGTAVYTAAFTPPTQLVNITNTSLLACQQPTIVDASSNNFAITVAGNAQVSSFTPFPAPNLTPTGNYINSSASGIWSLNKVAYWIQQGLWPNANNIPPDSYFNYVTLLLSGDGTNGAQNNTFLDSSTNNFTITRNGNTTQGTFSPYGSLWSNYFNGSTDYLKTTNANFSVATGDFTAEAFVYATRTESGSSGGAGTIMVNAADNITSAAAVSWFVDIESSGTLTATIYYGSSATSFNAGTLPLNQWVHVAFVRSGNNFYLYKNGVRYSTTSSATLNTQTNLFIGGCVGNGSTYYQWPGYINNARFVKGTALYTAATITVPTANLTAVSGTQLLTCQSNRFVDNSTNAVAINTTGSPSVQRFSPFNPTAAYSASTIGGSGYFDGTGDYLTAPDNAAWDIGSAKTVEAWVYLTSGDQKIICGQVSQFWLSTGLTTLGVSSGKFGISFLKSDDSWYGVSSTTSYAFNRWYYVAATWDGTYIRMFVNGVLETTSPSQSGTTWKSSSSGTLDIGSYSGDPNTYGLIGYISDVRITNSTLYTSTFSIPTAPLPAVANTALLTHFTNAGIPDAAMQNDLETVGNAQVSTSVKKYGTGSLAFDGTGDWLVGPRNWSIAANENFTIEGWFYLTAAQANYRMIVADGTKYFTINSSGLEIQFGTNSGTIASATYSFSQNTWYHIAVVRNSNSVVIYINGTALSMTQGTQSAAFLDTGSIIYISRYTSGSDYPWVGYIDDLRITKSVARYTANFIPPAYQFATY